MHRFCKLFSITVVFLSILPTGAGADPGATLQQRRLEPVSETGVRDGGGDSVAVSRKAGGGAARRIESSGERPGPRSRHDGFRIPEPRPVAADYVGAENLRAALEDPSRSRPTALAAADFDEDGVPDLVSGYATADGGVLTLHRGNLDAIYPNNADAHKRRAAGTFTDAPFLTPAQVFGVPAAPDFLAAGDFDADGHWDVVAAARGGNALFLLLGDGHGGLGAARSIALAGSVTVMVTGEINRRDGLADVVVGILGPDGPAVLVFENPTGALSGEPEVLRLPDAPTALVLDLLDGDPGLDLAVATAGGKLQLIQGRDRKLSLDPAARAAVVPAHVETIVDVAQRIEAMAAGDFVWDARRDRELAFVTADGALHVWGRQASLDDGSWEKIGERTAISTANVEFGTPRPAPVLVTARVSGLPLEELVVLDPVGRRMSVGLGEVREESERLGDPTTSELDATPVAVLPMRLNNDALADLVLLQAGASAPAVATSGAASTFTVTNVNDSGAGSLRQAIIDANANPGADTIDFAIGGGGSVETISVAAGTWLPDITETVTIDGSTQGCASPPCIVLDGSVAAATEPLTVTAPSVLRGLVIQSFNGKAIVVLGGADGTVIEGNYIGTDATGTVLMANTGSGVDIYDSQSSTVGGTVGAARNVIAGPSASGVLIRAASASPSATAGNVVQGNYIGTDATGAVALGNFQGVFLRDAQSNTVGGTSAGARNVISGNVNNGVVIVSSAFPAADTHSNVVLGNYIGTDATGTVDLGNTFEGVIIQDAASNTVGGTSVGARNVISGNDEYGVGIAEFNTLGGSAGNLVQGNYVGTDSGGAPVLPNAVGGIAILDASGITVGGTVAGAGNRVAGNGGPGVTLFTSLPQPTEQNLILGNSIFDNSGLGIDLGDDGVTPNDPGDADGGPNEFQNFPVFTRADVGLAETVVEGTLDSVAGSFRLEFFRSPVCDASGHGEGESFLGSTDVLKLGSGAESFELMLPVRPGAGEVITATATDPLGNTSEFSACFASADCTVLTAFGDTILAAADGNSLIWTAPADVHYIKGDLANVSTYAVTETGSLAAAMSLDISADSPLAGNGLFYLVRRAGCESWQTVASAEPGRDGALDQASCGDGVLDAGEACDAGGESATCDADCSLVQCGDGTLNATSGEVCDDGNTIDDGNGCSLTCQRNNVCGDGTVQDLFEQCDDGNEVNRDGCDNNCTVTACGNNVVTPGPVVTAGTGDVGDGVLLQIIKNTVSDGGYGSTQGGKIHSPAGAPDLFFRADSTPTFPGALSNGVQWSLGSSPGGAPTPWEGAVHGSDNWMKVIRDSDGAVSWVQFEFDLELPFTAEDPTLTSIPLYVTRTDGADFALAVAVAVGELFLDEQCDDGNQINGDGCDDNCTITACGNDVVTSGEACDDGNTIDDGDGCDASCQRNDVCGDGTVQSLYEDCDDGSAIDDGNGCDGDCQRYDVCGDGTVHNLYEECDDGGESATCDVDCTLAICGDGIVNSTSGESCDDGNTIDDGDGCDASCQSYVLCGDGTVQSLYEECDDGNVIDDGNGCDGSCQRNDVCGDWVVQNLYEECDDGNTTSGDGCDLNCTITACGNGVLTSGEFCDDGNNVNDDGCTSDCYPEFCGDGTVNNNGTEECDDGNQVNGDGCSSGCMIEYCGDGFVSWDEECDPGQNPSENCDFDCTYPECGDGLANMAAGEECDDGNPVNGDGCQSSCLFPVCGDNIQDAGEECDDGNTVDDGNGCDADCQRNDVCSDGTIQNIYEECDDANQTNDDGCDDNCTITACGNGVVTSGEQCDDGNQTNGDGCQSSCLFPVCGDNTLDAGEACDDGNTVDNGNGCDSACQANDVCGDGTVQSLYEQCDDGNTIDDGNGCDSACQANNVCGNGIIEDAFESCDDGNETNGDGCDDRVAPTVTAGTSDIGDGVQLLVTQNAVREGGEGSTLGGKVHSPGGAPDLFFRASSTPTFPGALDDFVQWSERALYPGYTARQWEGAVQGPDNWMKVIRDSDGAVSWAQFEFDFLAVGYFDPTLISIPLYVTRTDGADFPLAHAAASAAGTMSSGNCTITACGNGVIASGETCDDGNQVNGDGCDDDTLAGGNCTITGCGNGVMTSGEECDDGNQVNGDGCQSGCLLPVCGDNILDAGEACDDGNTIDDGNGCDAGCQRNDVCSDGTIQNLFEECDDGNQVNGDGCQSGCLLPVCGDNILDAGEACDDGNGIDLDGCGNDCTASCVPTPTQRFRDNGDGTISDRQTCLMWEKKTGTAGSSVICVPPTTCPDPHDVNNLYQWSLDSSGDPDGGAFTDFLVKLNAGAGFAGYTDWRLPTEGGILGDPPGTELQSILLTPYPCFTRPCIDPIFGPTCSTQQEPSSCPVDLYWSSSSVYGSPGSAYGVYFSHGFVYSGGAKINSYYVRAVRGGP